MNPSTTHLIASALALVAATQFATGTLLGKKGLETMDSVTGAMISIGSSAAIYWVVAHFTIKPEHWQSPAVYIFGAIGLMRPAISSMLAFEGTKRVGPTISATVASLSPMFAVIGGVGLLGEKLTPYTLAGTLGVVLGLMVLTGRGKLPRSWPVWALLFPLGAALIRAVAHVAARLGLLILPNVIFSGLVAYTVSFLVAGSFRFVKGPADGVAWSLRGAGWFVLAGLANSAAIFCLNFGLMLGGVVVASPLAATFPVWTLIGSWLFLGTETLTARTVLGVLIAVPSVILLTLGH